MKKEFVRVYDKNNQMFSEYIDRKLLPIKGFYFNLVNIWIIDSNKNILIQQRSQNKSLFPNQYECVAGAVVLDESILQAAIRETKEELGLNLEPIQFNKVLRTVDHKICYFMTTYIVKLDKIEIEKIKYDTQEVQLVKLVDLKTLSLMIKQNMFTYDIKNRFKKLKTLFKKYFKK